MWKRLYQAIAQRSREVWQQTGRARELLRLFAGKRQRDQEDRRRSAARARFWADLREGQREAEAHCSRQDQ